MEALSIITPDLQKRIDEVEKLVREGNCVTCSTKDELNAYLESR